MFYLVRIFPQSNTFGPFESIEDAVKYNELLVFRPARFIILDSHFIVVKDEFQVA